MNYKSPDNSLHFIEPEYAHLLPAGCIAITQEEASTIRVTTQAAAQAARTYAEKRIGEYPPVTDYLDGIAKGDQAQIDKYIADCLAVKTKYPKGA